eukprot:5078694-Ditylum_brightwellii.AAC.1
MQQVKPVLASEGEETMNKLMKEPQKELITEQKNQKIKPKIEPTEPNEPKIELKIELMNKLEK